MPITHLLSAPSQFVDVALDPEVMARAIGAAALCEAVVGLHAPPLALLAGSLASEASAGGPDGRVFADSIVVAIATWLAGTLGETPRPGALTSAQIGQVRDYIEAHLHENLGLDRLAAQVGYSTVRFARAFRAATTSRPPGTL